ncbi:MAG: DUF739 family protein [Clostridia bacterium]|nr:DUF739 family protein [Clostridia bacterium]
MTRTDLLQGKMREKGVTIESLAIAVGISRTSMFNKIHNKVEFLISEVQKIAIVLGLSDEDVQLIFFTLCVE